MKFTPIDKPTTQGVYYVGDKFEKVRISKNAHGLIVKGPNFDNVDLRYIYTQWFVPVLPVDNSYNEAVEVVVKMARSTRNTWMSPTDDSVRCKDYSDWIQEEIEGWQGTDHFALTYGNRIVEMARDLAEKNNMTGDKWIGIWEDLLTEFWCEWEETHNTAKFWTEKNKTIVIFRVDRAVPHDVFALFPTIPSDNYGKFCTCYQHVGQHSGADYYHCIRASRPAKPNEYADLKAELEGRGYVLIVKQRASTEMHAVRKTMTRD